MIKHYTIPQVLAMREQFKEMLKEATRNLLSHGNYKDINSEYKHDIDGQLFTFINRSSGISTILLGEPTPLTVVATSTVFIHGRPYVISAQLVDFTQPFEEALPDTLLETLTDGFINVIITNMARNFYYTGMSERIDKHIKEYEFEAISDHTELNLLLGYNSHGYIVELKSENGTPIVRDEHFNGTPAEEKVNLQIFSRYLENAIIIGLATEMCWKDRWSATLN